MAFNYYANLYPHPDHADIQPYAKTILLTHIFMRGLPIAGIFGTIIPVTKRVIFRRPATLPLGTAILSSSATSVFFTTMLLSGATASRMWGKEEIEWKDRSWRLLENKGQKEVDDWTLGFGAAGAVLGAATVKAPVAMWRGAIGGLSIGTVAGTIGYMAYRHGLKGGKWEEQSQKD